MPLTRDQKIAVGVGLGLATATALTLAALRTHATTPTPQATINISAPTTDTVGTPVTITATYLVNGTPMQGVTLYLFAAYEPPNSTATPNPSTFSLVSKATTNSSGQATWSFTPEQAGEYYLDVSDNTSNT